MTEIPQPNVRFDEELLSPGDMVDHFKVMRSLGAGGMGEVFLARDTKLGRKVALKIIRPSSIGTMSAVKGFLAEARLTARFNHPHIVTLYAVGEHEGCPYLALEYLEGQTLRQRMREQLPGLKETLRIGLAIAEALAEAHRMKILHRDLKPENVLIPKDGRLRVLDFGIAKALKHEGESSETIEMMSEISAPVGEKQKMSGTPAYIAPELWKEQDATEAVDIWAYGIVIHELFLGRHPLEPSQGGVFSAALLAGILSPEPVAVDSAARSKAPDLTELIEQCLSKDPDKRPPAEVLVGRLKKMLSKGERMVAPEESPFRGLQPFSEEHAAYFFGREAEIAAFLERLRADPVLPVLGPSGAGKSSFVQAGVIPMLREQGPWTVIQLRPGNRPFLTLAARFQGESPTQRPRRKDELPTLIEGARKLKETEPDLESAATPEEIAQQLHERPETLFMRLLSLAESSGTRVLLFVDQLEELYTLVEDEEVRRRFMQAICTAADDAADPVRVIFTLRDDFLGRVAEGVEARNALSRVTVIRTPGPEALKEVLTRAAETAGYGYDQPGLVSKMVAEVQGEPASLALLQFAARMLWERRDEERRLLLTSAYEAIGGVAGALAEHADGVLEGLSASQVRTARELLLRLVTAEGTRSVVSWQIALEGLGPEAEEVLARLVNARLVTVRKSKAEETAEAELELVHESLINSWTRLSRWVDESQEDRAALAEMSQAAELWHRRGRRDEEVWYGEALHEALRSVERCSSAVPEKVTTFLQAGKRHEEGRLRRRRMLLTSGVAVLFIIAVVSVIVAMIVAEKGREARIQRDRAELQRREVRKRWAEAQREGARAALGRGDQLEAIAKLRGSLEAQDSPLARILWWRVSRDPLIWRKKLGSVVYDVAFSPDGKTLAVASQDHNVYLFDAQTTRVQVLRGHHDQVLSVVFSPDGSKIASGSFLGLVRVVDLKGGTVRNLTGASAAIRRLAFSPDGKHLAAAVWDKTVRVWDLTGGSEPKVMTGHTAYVSEVVWSPDGKRLVSGGLDGTVRLWDFTSARQLKLLEGDQAGVYSLALSPDGRQVAAGGGDKKIRIWRLAANTPAQVLQGHAAGVTRVLFTKDGKRLISGSWDNSIRTWDLSRGAKMSVLARHRVNGLALSPDGTRLASGGPDREIRLWKLSTGPAPVSSLDLSSGVAGVAFSPDGQQVAAGYRDKSVRLWDVATGRISRILRGHEARVYAVVFGPDGKTLASASEDKTVRLWDLARDVEPRVLAGHRDAVRSLDFSPDGRSLASGDAAGAVRTWDVSTGSLRRAIQGHTSAVTGVQFSPDGRTLAMSQGKTIQLLDSNSGRIRFELSGHTGRVSSVSFSRDGRQLASGGWDRTIRLWDLHKRTSRIVGEHKGRIYWLDFHPDGQRIGAASSDGIAKIWNLTTGKQTTLHGHHSEVNQIRFSPDGRVTATGSDDGTVRLWDVETGRPIWRCPMLHLRTLQLFTHQGWTSLGSGPAHPNRGTRWKQAVEQRAVTASETDEGDLLCLRTHSGVEAWDLVRDRRLFSEPLPEVSQVLAHTKGCITLANGEVNIYSRSSSFAELTTGATAIEVHRDEILIAAGRRILVYGRDGKRRATYQADVRVSTMLLTGPWLVVGYKEGTIDLVPRNEKSKRTSLSLEGVPSSAVVSLLPGPMGTLAIGFANGLVGLWDIRNGSRLFSQHLHGPVTHMMIQEGRLFTASDLGDFQVIDLSAFDIEYCDLVRAVWRSVPVVWEGGLAVRRSPPARHRCASPAGNR